ncbi:hypothetical protein BO71DRAFT_434170 [Aspergillus ellipticus CBS 707.79]|uniref:Uncharacterized protein n=1 Tax=Aspergillus ellipticus CBS 707.79 TaxID=1448320 RepID=A0A319CYK2_9EURO|nr:hypothetical protein BO71DRAFT_434170 [Aspergillus ellipticus CBS 707.79]
MHALILLLPPLTLLLTTPLLAMDTLESSDVPNHCWSVCGPVVGLTEGCGHRYHDDDSGDKDCVCDWSEASTLLPLCEACIAYYSDDDDDDDDDNAAYDILTSCSLSTTTWNAAAASSVLSTETGAASATSTTTATGTGSESKSTGTEIASTGGRSTATGAQMTGTASAIVKETIANKSPNFTVSIRAVSYSTEPTYNARHITTQRKSPQQAPHPAGLYLFTFYSPDEGAELTPRNAPARLPSGSEPGRLLQRVIGTPHLQPAAVIGSPRGAGATPPRNGSVWQHLPGWGFREGRAAEGLLRRIASVPFDGLSMVSMFFSHCWEERECPYNTGPNRDLSIYGCIITTTTAKIDLSFRIEDLIEDQPSDHPLHSPDHNFTSRFILNLHRLWQFHHILAFRQAVRSGDTELMRFLLDSGIEVRGYVYGAVVVAIRRGFSDIVEMLAERGIALMI